MISLSFFCFPLSPLSEVILIEARSNTKCVRNVDVTWTWTWTCLGGNNHANLIESVLFAAMNFALKNMHVSLYCGCLVLGFVCVSLGSVGVTSKEKGNRRIGQSC